MSKSYSIVAQYKNNKKTCIGLHSGLNVNMVNESFLDMLQHLTEKWNKYISPNLDKFKKITICKWVSSDSFDNGYIDKQINYNPERFKVEDIKELLEVELTFFEQQVNDYIASINS